MAAVKFEGVDVLDFLGQVVELHTQHYKDDFDIDKELIQNLAACRNGEDEQLLWMSRTCGTYCLWERDVYLQDSHENKVWRFYHEQTKILFWRMRSGWTAYRMEKSPAVSGLSIITPMWNGSSCCPVRLKRYRYCSRMVHRRPSPMIPICSRSTGLRQSMESPNV